jgi:hypothetical protein
VRIALERQIDMPLTVPSLLPSYFRIRMVNSKLYRRNAVKHNVPYKLIFRKYWKTLIGTAGTWFLYDFVAFPNGREHFSHLLNHLATCSDHLCRWNWQFSLSVDLSACIHQSSLTSPP